MTTYIHLFPLENDPLRAYTELSGQPLHRLGPLAPINVFVGANNSGKSRLLRRIFTMRQRGTLSSVSWTTELREAVLACEALADHFPDAKDFGVQLNVVATDSAAFIDADRSHLDVLRGNNVSWTLSRLQVRGLIHELVEGDHPEGPISTHGRAFLGMLLRLLREPDREGAGGRTMFQFVGMRRDVNELTNRLTAAVSAIDRLASAMGTGPQPRELPAIYIPTLRTAVTLRQTPSGDVREDDMFLATTVFHYKMEKWDKQIFTGLGLYNAVNKNRSATKRTRDQHRAFEGFVSRHFFGGQPVEITAVTEDALRMTISVGDGPERQLHDVGDGIGALIVLTYQFFLAPPNAWMFVEEPETHLHPGLQRVFIDALLGDPTLGAKGLRTFLTTHSNHVLSMALHSPDKISVFGFERMQAGPDETFRVRALQGPDLHVLNDLGVENASVLLANCTLWVEGPTDRMYLAAYLRAFCNRAGKRFRPIEDLHYAFLEYGGSNLAHYTFDEDAPARETDEIIARFISNRIFLLADKDRAKETKHERLRGYQNAGFVYATTPTIEIENILPPNLLKEILPEWLDLAPQTVEAAKIEASAYADVGLGRYLVDTFGEKISSAVKASSGTLAPYYKRRLAELACARITWDNMGEEAQKLATHAYEFIAAQNPSAVAASGGG